MKKTPAEIKQERLDRQAARRKKQEEKAQKKKEKIEEAEQKHQEERLKAEAEEKAKADGNPGAEGQAEAVQDDHGIKEPDKEPAKVKRLADAEPDSNPGLDDLPVLEKETSGLAHLRRRRRPLVGK